MEGSLCWHHREHLGGHLPFLWVCSEPQNLLQPQRFSVHAPQMEHLNPPESYTVAWHRGVARECPKPSVPQPCLAERGLAGANGRQQR